MKKIQLISDVVFKDCNGNVVKHYKAGTILEYTAKKAHYWVTSMGGIWDNEAKELETLPWGMMPKHQKW